MKVILKDTYTYNIHFRESTFHIYCQIDDFGVRIKKSILKSPRIEKKIKLNFDIRERQANNKVTWMATSHYFILNMRCFGFFPRSLVPKVCFVLRKNFVNLGYLGAN